MKKYMMDVGEIIRPGLMRINQNQYLSSSFSRRADAVGGIPPPLGQSRWGRPGGIPRPNPDQVPGGGTRRCTYVLENKGSKKSTYSIGIPLEK